MWLQKISIVKLESEEFMIPELSVLAKRGGGGEQQATRNDVKSNYDFRLLKSSRSFSSNSSLPPFFLLFSKIYCETLLGSLSLLFVIIFRGHEKWNRSGRRRTHHIIKKCLLSCVTSYCSWGDQFVNKHQVVMFVQDSVDSKQGPKHSAPVSSTIQYR